VLSWGGSLIADTAATALESAISSFIKELGRVLAIRLIKLELKENCKAACGIYAAGGNNT
jgi:hypothetical protein